MSDGGASDDIGASENPDYPHETILVERVPFATCTTCGGNIVLRVWGEGIDSAVWCENTDCTEKEIYR